MFTDGTIFLAGAVLNGAAVNVMMLIISLILLGIGIGFTMQVTLIIFLLLYSILQSNHVCPQLSTKMRINGSISI